MILQDTFVAMAMSGLDPDWLLRLDVPQFDSVAESWSRQQASVQLADLNVMRMAQHGEGNDYRNFTRDLKRAAKVPNTKRDAQALDKSMGWDKET